MLDLAAAGTPAFPSWLKLAPLPGAALCVVQAGALHRCGHAETIAASPALLSALQPAAASGDTVLAYDSSGEAWRLRHLAATPLWLLQSVADSRARLLAGLRSVLARELADRVLHDLRNPLNALSLHTDLIARLLAADGGGNTGRALSSVEVIRQRAGNLRRRQDAAVALWLDGPPLGDGYEPDLAAVVEDGIQLLRGHLSLQDVRLRGEALERIGTMPLRGGAAPVQIAVIALLYIAGAGARRDPAAAGAEVILQAQRDGQRLVLELQAPLDGRQLAREAADCDAEALLAGLALLLQPAGISLRHDAALAATQLVIEGGTGE